MKFIQKSGFLACAITAAMSSSFTWADDDSGWYIGGNVGQARAHIDKMDLADGVLPNGWTTNLTYEDSLERGQKFYGGYQLNRYLSIEGGYFDLGKFRFSQTTVPSGTLDTTIKYRGVNLDLVGYLPFNDTVSAFARIGANYALTQDTFTASGPGNILSGKYSHRATYPKAGVGLQFKFNEAVALRLESERYRLDNAVGGRDEVDLFSVGLVYRFGTQPAPAPVVVAPPPAPAPVVAAPPPAPRFEKFTLSATELFGFDSDTLQMPQPKLDQIADALKGEGSPRQIEIVGYTDRLGSTEYNQKLSERRATSVKNYLIGKGIAADRLAVVGKGESDPVVQCSETKKAALIECLKPNRRVEIDQVVVERKVNP